MKLYILKRNDERPAWDVANGFVVRADSPDAARLIAAAEAGDEGRAAWINPTLSTCDELQPDGDAGCVILRDYQAG